MTSISLPDPVVRRPGPPPAGASALERDLRRQVDGEVRFDAGSRGAYSTDASNYRQVPIGVVVPHTVDAGAAAVEVCPAARSAGRFARRRDEPGRADVQRGGRHRLVQVLPWRRLG